MRNPPPEQLQALASSMLELARLQLEVVERLHAVIRWRDEDEPVAPGQPVPPEIDLRPAPPAPAVPPEIDLTPRERDVLRLLGRGLSNHRIATALGISSHTVRSHLQAVFRKLGANQRSEAIVRAAQAGLLEELAAVERPVEPS